MCRLIYKLYSSHNQHKRLFLNIKEQGRLESIWIKRMKRGPMDEKRSATLIAHKGIFGNADIGGKRQVTLIEKEVWERHAFAIGLDIDPSERRANLMVSGIDLRDSRKHILQIGECRIRIYGETKPCERMDELFYGLAEIMYPSWGGGAYGEVLDDGEISVGDRVFWSE